MKQFNILVVDDDPNIRKLLHELLVGMPEYEVLIAVDGKQAVKVFTEKRIDIVLTDIHMPGFTGLEMMADMKKIHQQPEILVMTANGTPENVEKARQVGARAVILKPFENLDIIEIEIEKAAAAVMAAREADGSPTVKPPVTAPAVPEPLFEPPAELLLDQAASGDPTAAIPLESETSEGTMETPSPASPVAEPAASPGSGSPSVSGPKQPPAPAGASVQKPAPETPLPEVIEVEVVETPAPDAPLPTPDPEPVPAAPEPEPSLSPSDPKPAPAAAVQAAAPSPPEPAPTTAAPKADLPLQVPETPKMNSAVTTRLEIPRIDAWKDVLVGNEPPPRAAVPVAGGPAGRSKATPATEQPVATPSPAPAETAASDRLEASMAAKSEPVSSPVSTKAAVQRPIDEKKSASRQQARKPQPPPKPQEQPRRRGILDLQALREKLFGKRSLLDSGGSRARSGGEELLEGTPPSPAPSPAPSESVATETAEKQETSPPAKESPQTVAVPRPELTLEKIDPENAVQKPAQPAAAVERKPPEQRTNRQIPAELRSIFTAGSRLATGKLKMQVPIVCLQTWEEQAAMTALQHLAAELQRDFHTWSVTRGIIKGDGQSMGEMYCDPLRALDFIRRQKQNGLYVLVDFRNCLQDQRIVRSLREMFMDGETARCMMVLTAPELSMPPELQPACKSFEWPEAAPANFGEVLEEVREEVATSSGQSIDLDPETRRLLIERVQEMPLGRARFEFACALMARVQSGR